MITLLKRFWYYYVNNMMEVYRPLYENGISPFM